MPQARNSGTRPVFRSHPLIAESASPLATMSIAMGSPRSSLLAAHSEAEVGAGDMLVG
jgi:hypothetical protein